MAERHFGTPLGVTINQFFEDRQALRAAGVHMPTVPGISGTKAEGADSIVLNGGYVDDEDHGDYIIYTGAGGNSTSTKHQVQDQTLEHTNNAGLVTSEVEKLPVRVVRGARAKTVYAPPVGYVYAGLYEVTSHWLKQGIDGFQIVQFRLDRIPEQAAFVSNAPADPDPAFATSEVTRRIRDSAMSRSVKSLYANACQVCGTVIKAFDGRTYSEGAHVAPLGKPHLGSDTAANLLCLCPNHHTALDVGGIVIDDDFAVRSTADGSVVGQLKFVPGHAIELANVRYHRALWTTASHSS